MPRVVTGRSVMIIHKRLVKIEKLTIKLHQADPSGYLGT